MSRESLRACQEAVNAQTHSRDPVENPTDEDFYLQPWRDRVINFILISSTAYRVGAQTQFPSFREGREEKILSSFPVIYGRPMRSLLSFVRHVLSSR